MLPGEDFAVLEYAGGWAWGYCLADHITGYVEAIALADPIEPTHIVCEKCAPVTPDGRITSTDHRQSADGRAPARGTSRAPASPPNMAACR